MLVEPRAPGYHVYSAFNVPRLGLPLMARILRSRGHSVEVYVQQQEAVPMSALRQADLVGVSTITSTAGEAYNIAALARGMGKTVVMGGPHVTFVPEEALRYCDVVVRGEGDETFPELIGKMEAGEDLRTVRGLSYYDGDDYVATEDRPFVSDLDSLPAPDLNSIHFGGKMPIVPVQTSRGCPYHCTFCSVTSMFGHRYRVRNVENVLDELQRYNGRSVFFVDDNFTAMPQRTMQLLTRMGERGIRLNSWSAQTRVDIADNPELIALMRKTRCSRVYIGFESVNPLTLEHFNKRQDVDDVKRSIETLHSHRIPVHGMFVLGTDDDAPGAIEDTLRFADRMRIDTVQFMSLIPLPGTQIAHELEMEGRIITHEWNLYDGHHVVFQPRNMAPEYLQQGILWGMKEFYSWRNAVKFAVRSDWVNAFMRVLGGGIIRKASPAIRNFGAWLRTHKEKAADWSGGFEFDQALSHERLLEFKQRIADGARKRYETARLKISTRYEIHSRAVFLALEGRIDRRRASFIKRHVTRLAHNSPTLVIDFEKVREITPEGVDYLARKLSRFSRRVSIKLIGIRGEFREKLAAMTVNVPIFELFDSMDSLRSRLIVNTRI